MADSWDELKEKAGRQPSAGVIRTRMDYPFKQIYMDVRDDNGAAIGVLMIEELVPLPGWITSVRAALWEKLVLPPPMDSAQKLFKYYKESDPFPDEDTHE